MFKPVLTAVAVCLCTGFLSSRAAGKEAFPAHTHWILSVNVKGAHASPLMCFLADKIDTKKRTEADHKLAAVKAAFGIDLLNDIDRFVIAGNGDAKKWGVAYIYGRFDTQRLTTVLAGAKNYSSANHNGIAVQSWLDETDNKQKCLAFVNPNLALLSNTADALLDALDTLSGKKPGLPPDSPLNGASDCTGQSLLTLHAFDLAAIVGSTPKAEIFKQADALRLCIDTPDDHLLRLALSVTADMETTAQQIQQAFQGIQAIAMLRAAEAPEPAAIASQTKITCQGRSVGATILLSKDMLEGALRARAERLAAKNATRAATITQPAVPPAN